MEKLSILLIFLFIILCIGQVYMREPFATADISNATVTMSLSDLLYYSGGKGAGNVTPQTYGMNGFYGNPSVSYDDTSLESYLFLKNEMSKEVKNKLRERESTNLVNIEPSVIQGSSYMETVPLKVPASCSQ